MGDISGFGRNCDTTFRHLTTIGLVWDSVAFTIDLRQGVIYRVVNLELQHIDVVFGFNHYVGTPHNTFNFGVNLAIEQRENHIHEKFVE